MAQGLLNQPNDQDQKFDPAERDFKGIIDHSFSPQEQARLDARAGEQSAVDNAEANAQAADTPIQQQEKTPPNTWETNVDDDSQQPAAKKLSTKYAKRWITGGIISAVVGFAGLGFGGTAAQHLFLIHIDHAIKNFITKKMEPAIDNRIDSVLVKWYVADSTCSGGAVKCKYKKGLSDDQIQKLKDIGLNPKTEDAGGGKKRLVSLDVVQEDGSVKKATSSTFREHYRSNVKFASAINRAAIWPDQNMMRNRFAVSWYLKHKIARDNFLGSTDETDEKKMAQSERKNNYGQGNDTTPKGGNAAADGQLADAANQVQSELAADDYTQDPKINTANTIEANNVSPGQVVGLAKSSLLTTGVGLAQGAFSYATYGCLGFQLLRTIDLGGQVYQAIQLARYTMGETSALDKIQAGDGTSPQANYLGNGLMKPSSQKSSAGKNYAESAGMTLATQGAVANPADLARFANGGRRLSLVQQLEQVLKVGGLNRTTCKQVNSWYGQLALTFIGVIANFATLDASSLAGAAMDLSVGVVIGAVLTFVTPTLITYFANVAAPGINDPEGGLGKMNALVSGGGAIANFVGRNQGGRPIRKAEAASVAADIQREVARVDAMENIGKSPFATDNPNSITNQIAAKLAPYVMAPTTQANFQNLANMMLSPFSLVAQSSATLISPVAYADDPANLYGGQFCNSKALNDLELMTDAFCNPIISESPRVVAASLFDPQAVADYMVDNNYVDRETGEPAASGPGEDFKKFSDACMTGDTPLSPDGGGIDVTEDVDTSRCLKGVTSSDLAALDDGAQAFTANAVVGTNKPNAKLAAKTLDPEDVKITMFRMYQMDSGIDQGVSASLDGTLGDDKTGEAANAGGDAPAAGSNFADAKACQDPNLTHDDNANILCNAIKNFDPYGYVLGGGHGGSAASFMRDFNAGKFTPGKSQILDCSGLVRMAIFSAFGQDIGGGSTSTLTLQKNFFQQIPINQVKPGDVVVDFGTHMAIVSGPSSNGHFNVFAANNPNTDFPHQIDYSQIPFSGYLAYRYKGPKQ